MSIYFIMYYFLFKNVKQEVVVDAEEIPLKLQAFFHSIRLTMAIPRFFHFAASAHNHCNLRKRMSA